MILTNKLHITTGGEKGMNIIGEIEEFLINFIMPILLLVATIAIFALYVLPTHKSLPDLKSQLEAVQQEVNVLQAKVAQLTALQENRELVMADLVKLSWALEERDKVPELTEQVRLMSKDSGVAFKSLDYANANKNQIVSLTPQTDGLTPDPELYREEEVNVDIDVKDFASAVAFLKSSETSIRLFRVESLKLSAQNQVTKADLVMASPYLNPAFSTYSQSAAPIDLKNPAYRLFMGRLDTFKNYAKDIDATLPKL